MSAEDTPILSGAIPAFELFMSSWQSMVNDADLEAENVARFIRPGLAIATKYYKKFDDTDAYIIAMCKCGLLRFLMSHFLLDINPSIRFEWIRQNWSAQDQAKARQIILDKVVRLSLHQICTEASFKA
jgi:hypothetical protein